MSLIQNIIRGCFKSLLILNQTIDRMTMKNVFKIKYDLKKDNDIVSVPKTRQFKIRE